MPTPVTYFQCDECRGRYPTESEARRCEHEDRLAKPAKHHVVVQRWSLQEADWGQTACGYTLHQDPPTLESFLSANYVDRRPGRRVPLVFRVPQGAPYEGLVDDQTFAELTAAGGTLDRRRADAGKPPRAVGKSG